MEVIFTLLNEWMEVIFFKKKLKRLDSYNPDLQIYITVLLNDEEIDSWNVYSIEDLGHFIVSLHILSKKYETTKSATCVVSGVFRLILYYIMTIMTHFPSPIFSIII